MDRHERKVRDWTVVREVDILSRDVDFRSISQLFNFNHSGLIFQTLAGM